MRTPQEVLGDSFRLPPEMEALYGGRGKEVTFYYDPIEAVPGIKITQLRVLGDFLYYLALAEQGNKPFIAACNGAMAGGKSTFICLTAGVMADNALVFKHDFDIERRGPDVIPYGQTRRVEARHYSKLGDVLTQLGSEKVVLVDEIQFAPDTQQEAIAFVEELRNRGKHALLVGLDFDFGRRPWETTSAIVRGADRIFVLAASCVEPGCSSPAWFTQRNVKGEPAHLDDPQHLVGEVEDVYFPKCPSHHRVLPARGEK